MNSSGLFKAPSLILPSGRQDIIRPGVATMSLTIFLALCILALDFMIYVLFKWLYGDRRSAIARRVAQQRKAAQAEAAGLIIFPARKSPPACQEPGESAVARHPANQSGILFSHNSHTTRIA